MNAEVWAWLGSAAVTPRQEIQNMQETEMALLDLPEMRRAAGISKV